MTEEIIFKTVVDTGKSVKDTDKLKESLKGVGKEGKQAGDKNAEALAALNKRVEEGNFTMKEAAKITKAYADIALKAGGESPIGRAAINAAGALKDKIGDLRMEMNNAGNDGANMQAGLQLAGTLTAGYGALQGVIGLVGTENKDLAKSMQKLQAVGAILAGIEQIRASLEQESLLVTKGKVVWTKVATAAEYIYATAVGTTTGAMKALRIAMMAIPIIAIIAAIVALIAILVSFFSEEEKAEEQNNALNASFEAQNKALEANGRAYKRNSDNKRALMVSEKASSKDLFEFDKQRLIDEEVMRQKNLRMLEENIKQKRLTMIQAIKEENEELTKTIETETHAQEDKYAELRELDGQYLVDKKLLEEKYAADEAKVKEDKQKDLAAKQKEWARKAKEERDKQAQIAIDQQRLLEDLFVQNIQDADARKVTALKLQQQREMEETVKKYGAKSAVIAQLELKQASDLSALLAEIEKAAADKKTADEKKIADKAKADAELKRKNDKAKLEADLTNIREDFDATINLKKQLAELEMSQELENADLTEGEKLKIKADYAAKIEELNKEVADKDIARQKQVATAAQNITQMGLTAAQGLADAFFDYKIGKAKAGTAAELALEKRKFEVNKKLQIAQAVMQGIQATLAAYSSGAAIPVVGVVAGPAFAAAAGITAALNIAKIRNTQFEGGTGSTSTPSASAPSVNVPNSNTQQSSNTLTNGLSGSNNSLHKVVLVDSDLKAALGDNGNVKIVSNIG